MPLSGQQSPQLESKMGMRSSQPTSTMFKGLKQPPGARPSAVMAKSREHSRESSTVEGTKSGTWKSGMFNEKSREHSRESSTVESSNTGQWKNGMFNEKQSRENSRDSALEHSGPGWKSNMFGEKTQAPTREHSRDSSLLENSGGSSNFRGGMFNEGPNKSRDHSRDSSMLSSQGESSVASSGWKGGMFNEGSTMRSSTPIPGVESSPTNSGKFDFSAGSRLPGNRNSSNGAVPKKSETALNAATPPNSGPLNERGGSGESQISVLSHLVSMQRTMEEQQGKQREMLSNLTMQWEQRFAALEQAVNSGLKISTTTAATVNEHLAKFVKLDQILDGADGVGGGDGRAVAALARKVNELEHDISRLARELADEKAKRINAIDDVCCLVEGKVAMMNQPYKAESYKAPDVKSLGGSSTASSVTSERPAPLLSDDNVPGHLEQEVHNMLRERLGNGGLGADRLGQRDRGEHVSAASRFGSLNDRNDRLRDCDRNDRLRDCDRFSTASGSDKYSASGSERCERQGNDRASNSGNSMDRSSMSPSSVNDRLGGISGSLSGLSRELSATRDEALRVAADVERNRNADANSDGAQAKSELRNESLRVLNRLISLGRELCGELSVTGGAASPELTQAAKLLGSATTSPDLMGLLPQGSTAPAAGSSASQPSWEPPQGATKSSGGPTKELGAAPGRSSPKLTLGRDESKRRGSNQQDVLMSRRPLTIPEEESGVSTPQSQ